MAENPDVMKHYNMKGGLGVLLYGAPGTGKTMIAEAIANKLQWPLFMITPSDIFKSYVGASEAAVKQLFKELEPCPDGAILFVDECESIFSKRTSETKDYKSAVTNELLQRINGFGVDGSKRILIGATNRPDQIDPAYLRYKRFSYQIHITPPDDVAKRSIIESKLNVGKIDKERDEIELEAGFGVEDILAYTNRGSYEETELGFVNTVNAYYSAADLTGIIEESCRMAIEKMRDDKSKNAIPLTRKMFDDAFAKTPPSISSKLLDAYEKFKEDPTLLDKYYGNR
jgi:SpoVK/Ycf46/Vps4 family AAA+-type ATPase